MSRLCELRITQTADDGTDVRFDVALVDVEEHPPTFAVRDGAVVGVTSERALDTTQITVRGAELDGWITEGPPADVLALTEGPLYTELLDRSQAPHQWGVLPPSVGRIAVTTTPDRAALPWADLIVTGGGDKLALIRRGWTGPGRTGRPLDGRMQFALTDDAQIGALDVQLFDGFVQEAADQHGALRWDAEPTSADLWHVTAVDAADALEVIDDTPCPRVVVAQLTGAPAFDPAVGPLVDRAMTQGAWAVVAAQVPASITADFFQPFYRKVFHNWPLEWCTWLGATAAPIPVHDARLFARSGGELALSLWRIGAEQAVAPVAALIERDEPAARPGGPRARRPRRTRGPAARRDGDDDTAAPPERRRRVVASLQRDIAASVAEIRAERAAEPLDRGSSLVFEEEIHDYGALIEAADEVANVAVPEADDVEALAAEVAAAPPGPRHTTVSFLDGGRRLDRDEPLAPDAPYQLLVAIEPLRDGPHVSVPFDEAPLADELKRRSVVALDVVVFAPATEFTVATSTATLALPRVGPSLPVTFEVTPRHDGWCALRVAIYHRGTLLQSVAVRGFVWASDPPGDAVPTVRPLLDWAASTDLQLLDDLPTPAVSIFSNDGPDGSHWIGVFSQDGDGLLPLRRGQMRSFDSTDLTAKAGLLRDLLQAAHGTDTYLYPSAPPDDPDVIAFGRKAMVELAVAGWELYAYLFRAVSDEEFSRERRTAFNEALQQDAGIISIARCDSTWSLPWAAMYDKRVDTGRRAELAVCEVFETQLAGNRWTDDDALEHTADLLDDPAACHAQPDCPLRDDAKERVTVCPFGFWGIRHQIEQPLQQVRAANEDEVPDRLASEAFTQTSSILRPADQPLRIGAGAFPFLRVAEHEADIRTIDADVEWRTDRPDVMTLLSSRQGHHLVYFYCHGVTTHKYALRFGPKGDDLQNTIAYDNLFEEDIHWGRAGTPQPLVVIIACESAAASPDVAHAMFDQLRNVGATGVVGSEISIGVRLGREAGRMLMTDIAGGRSVGEAFLAMRRTLLRRHNPLGLVLTPNAPATLHVCDDPAGAGSCARHHRTRTSTG